MTTSPRTSGLARNRRRHKLLIYVGLIIATLFTSLPILFMVVSSLKPETQIFADLRSIRAFLPIGDVSLDNYSGVMDRVPAVRFIANSLLVTTLIVGIGLIVNSMIGFAISRMRWRGKGLILSLVLATLMVPFEAIAVPMVFWVSKLPLLSWEGDGFLLSQGMLNSYSVQVLPFVANALGIFLFVQQFNDIPRELDEAARIDGASWFGIYRRVIVPLSGPTFATVAIITMLPAWNQYLWPLMVVQQEELRPSSVGMQYFFQLNTAWGEVMAYATMITLPVLIVFFLFQRTFVTSISASGLKG
ncbi:carbohydrate ABC transporter permease [Brachybacterium sp. AOP42-E1-35]|uniref:carbohydrate ABC transporter permease n=1 Tax=Brachybacterium sp. AOP42-E1-35 TaxID=3457664 RepID=UPI00402B01A6